MGRPTLVQRNRRLPSRQSARPSTRPPFPVMLPRKSGDAGATVIVATEARQSSGPDEGHRDAVGEGRVELPTPRLSSVCSNQLSYGPSPAALADNWARNPSPLSCRPSDEGPPGGERFTEEKRRRRWNRHVFCRDARNPEGIRTVRLLGSSRSEVRLHTLEHP